MKATIRCLGALLLLVAAASLARANPYYYPCIPQAPDACGPGSYCTNYCGTVYGPNYYLRPPWPPVGTVAPCLSGPQFPVHPFARSPRDFFMWMDP
jgi:hypothetical protein